MNSANKLFCMLLCIVIVAEVCNAITPILIVHGGAGNIPEERVPGKLRGVKLAAKIGYQVLTETGKKSIFKT